MSLKIYSRHVVIERDGLPDFHSRLRVMPFQVRVSDSETLYFDPKRHALLAYGPVSDQYRQLFTGPHSLYRLTDGRWLVVTPPTQKDYEEEQPFEKVYPRGRFLSDVQAANWLVNSEFPLPDDVAWLVSDCCIVKEKILDGKTPPERRFGLASEAEPKGWFGPINGNGGNVTTACKPQSKSDKLTPGRIPELLDMHSEEKIWVRELSKHSYEVYFPRQEQAETAKLRMTQLALQSETA